MPWNRPTRDTLVDLLPGELVDRFEFRGRLVDARDCPLAGLLVYAYHADRTGEYGSKQYPTINTMAGCVSTGPGGGFIVRTYVPGMYGGPPHMHFEVTLPDRGRCVWHVNLRPDSSAYPLPNSANLGAATAAEYDEKHALSHLDATASIARSSACCTWRTGSRSPASTHCTRLPPVATSALRGGIPVRRHAEPTSHPGVAPPSPNLLAPAPGMMIRSSPRDGPVRGRAPIEPTPERRCEAARDPIRGLVAAHLVPMPSFVRTRSPAPRAFRTASHGSWRSRASWSR
jgi:hypothetical protein